MSDNTKPSSLKASNTNSSSLTAFMSHNTKPSSSTAPNTNPSNTQPRKRLIIKLSYPHGSRKRDSDSCATDENKRRKIQDSIKPTIFCYWVDSNYQTKSTALSQPKNNGNVVENKNMIKNQVSKTTPLSQPKDNMKDSVTRGGECGLKKAMECVKRRHCWLILKRMLVDRDGWDLKDPPKKAKFDKCKIKAIGLKEIERKMRLYATTDEFASDMRLVLSNAMVSSMKDGPKPCNSPCGMATPVLFASVRIITGSTLEGYHKFIVNVGSQSNIE
ncbi:hypothetical protein KIW84_023381 [Lathyrus oleraceus]|uniref:Bromo domain-containing protein n=1 Tax=Pisum sativum TaxID=3888 RepID=A0A9D4YCT7_PEA|nr:hypothetical protein KIW84_023381 [Pisum sativum]